MHANVVTIKPNGVSDVVYKESLVLVRLDLAVCVANVVGVCLCAGQNGDLIVTR